MVNTSEPKSTDESDANDTYALNALKDLDDIASENELDISKLNLSPVQQKISKNTVIDFMEKTPNGSKKLVLKSKSLINNLNESVSSNNSTYSDVSTPPMDSKSVPASPKNNTITAVKTNGSETNVSYSLDFTEDTGQSKNEMTAWERWFVMKQRQIRQRAEIEKKKKLLEEQKVKDHRQKKAEENERKQKMWWEGKRLEERIKKEKDKEMKKDDKGSMPSDYRFEKWYLKKLQEKKSQLQYSQELQKYEEIQKEMRKKKNERAQMEWMNKARQRPITPRVTYAYVGDSVIGFYDSTSHPPPTYINPIPWQT